jgi:hypothetical protein
VVRGAALQSGEPSKSAPVATFHVDMTIGLLVSAWFVFGIGFTIGAWWSGERRPAEWHVPMRAPEVAVRD